MKNHDIYIDWELPGQNPYKPLLTRVIAAALAAEGVAIPCGVDVLLTGDEGIRVLIGKENPNSAFADSSVIISKYRIGPDNTGAMGLIGPTRMDYSSLIPHLEYFSRTLGRLLEETLEEQK